MDDDLAWFVLIRAPGIGPVQLLKLLKIYDTPKNLLSLSEAELSQAKLKPETINYFINPEMSLIEKDRIWSEQSGHHFISFQNKCYPALLKEISAPPLGIFIDGSPEVLGNIQLGIVGSRNPTAVGKQTAENFAKQLAELDITITSGLALGIDFCSHLGALEAGGKTIAVMGNGLDKIYPARHANIAEKIRNNGALISEFPTGTLPVPVNFPRRNRIISGLSLGILVIEAARKSGSLITAKYALEQGREIFAIPGSIRNPLSKGCHYLIKQGAKLVESLDDIIEELNLLHCDKIQYLAEIEESRKMNGVIDANYRQVIDSISYDPVSVDKLIEITGLTADTVSSMLLILEVQGIVTSSGGLYTRMN